MIEFILQAALWTQSQHRTNGVKKRFDNTIDILRT